MSELTIRPITRPVYKVLHRPMTLCGVERRLFIGALLMGALTFRIFMSLLAGSLVTLALYVFGWWATQRDPQMLRIVLSSSQFRTRYDQTKHCPREIEVRPC
jgi:type IV secretory pathway VirB3-like protein